MLGCEQAIDFVGRNAPRGYARTYEDIGVERIAQRRLRQAEIFPDSFLRGTIQNRDRHLRRENFLHEANAHETGHDVMGLAERKP